MKPEKVVIRETVFVAVGTLVMSILMNAVFLIIGKWNITVLFGNLLSGIPSIANFFLMGMTVQKAVNETGKKAENFMRISMLLRMVLLFGVTLIGVLNLDKFNLISIFLPLFFPRIALLFRPLFGHKIENPDAQSGMISDEAEEQGGDDE